jgi:hypothetical protein
MVDRSPAPMQSDARLKCTRCGARIELCAFCQSPDCSHVICYRCLRQELRQSLALPHAHGG